MRHAVGLVRLTEAFFEANPGEPRAVIVRQRRDFAEPGLRVQASGGEVIGLHLGAAGGESLCACPGEARVEQPRAKALAARVGVHGERVKPAPARNPIRRQQPAARTQAIDAHEPIGARIGQELAQLATRKRPIASAEATALETRDKA